jgi:hypothetical protein
MALTFKSALIAIAALALSGAALAYDYVRDVLVGNTVAVTNLATGETSIFKLKADNTVERTMDGQTVKGTWTADAGKVCAIYPGENNGQPQCSEIPKDPVVVPSERETEVPNPTAGQPPVRLRIKYIKGQ